MEMSTHRFAELFAQLGLPNDDASIKAFLLAHAPLASELRLADAPFWAPAQAGLLRDELHDDADWAELIDQLDAALRHRG